MAIDWIKMRTSLGTHPKVVRILSAVCPQSVRNLSEKNVTAVRNLSADCPQSVQNVQHISDRLRVVGALHAVWSLFDTHTENGVLHGYTPGVVDDLIGWPGFSRAMIAVDWLRFDGDETLTVPEFDAHNGQSAKRRGDDQLRKNRSRSVSEKNVTAVRNLSEKNVTREEKIREEKKEEHIAADADDAPKKRASKKSLLTLTEWKESLNGELAFPASDPVHEIAASMGLPRDYLALAAREFGQQYAESDKRYKDWRAVFRNAVKGNWLRLWEIDRNGDYYLTTKGKQVERIHNAPERADPLDEAA